MYRKFAIAFAAIAAVVGLAYAGFDQYTSKNYTTLLAPTPIGVTSIGSGTNYTDTITATVTNSVQPLCVDCVGLPGKGALVMSLNPGNGAAGGVVRISFSTSATTNGTYVTVTNANGVASWAVTTTAANVVAPIVPNAQSRYWRATATATAVTNGSVDAIIVTE
jgi:hypothetical protein